MKFSEAFSFGSVKGAIGLFIVALGVVAFGHWLCPTLADLLTTLGKHLPDWSGK